MREGSKGGHRGAAAAILLIGGGVVAMAAWLGGDPGVAAAVFVAYVVLAVIAFIVAGRSGDIAAIMRGAGDERQRAIDLRATAAAGIVTTIFTVGGAIVSIARTGGDPGQYGTVCVVLGISYGAALVILKRRS